MGSSRAGTTEGPWEGWVVAIGGSTGSMAALCAMVAELPAAFAAPVLIVQHIGNHRSSLARRLAACGPLPAREAFHGEPLQPGVVYVAPPDAHLLAEPGRLRLSHGPKVNHTRPAIDPTLRTCALAFGPRAIGVVLSGRLDDGTAGLQDLKLCGGLAIVQDPDTAQARDMPVTALDTVAVDHCLAPEAIGQLLARIVTGPPPALPLRTTDAVARIRREQDASEGRNTMAFISADAEPSPYICPDCGGTLWQVRGSRPPRYACHIGHALSLQAMAMAQYAESEHVLRSAVRALRERAALMCEIEALERQRGNLPAARRAGQDAHAARDQADGLVRLIEHEDRGGTPG